VGYPLYYVSNVVTFADRQNTWGIYGMMRVGPPGLNAFLRGLNNEAYSYHGTGITGNPGVVELTSEARYLCNYYGLYPASYQTSTRALPTSIEGRYNLERKATVFKPVNGWIAAATFKHSAGGALTAIGLTRIPDIRVTALALLMYYHPQLYKSHFGARGTSRIVVLQLAKQGGD
jgi:hypothetical protein